MAGAANGDVEDQPIDDGSNGELVIGPGAGGMQPRPSEVKRALPPLTYQQEEMLKKAKRFAMEQSVQQVRFSNMKSFSVVVLVELHGKFRLRVFCSLVIAFFHHPLLWSMLLCGHDNLFIVMR